MFVFIEVIETHREKDALALSGGRTLRARSADLRQAIWADVASEVGFCGIVFTCFWSFLEYLVDFGRVWGPFWEPKRIKK